MEIGYFKSYSQANAFCILIFSILLFNDYYHNARQDKQLWFNRTLWVHIFYFLSDIGWASMIAGLLPRYPFGPAFNFTNYVLLSLIAYEWFMYMAAAENMNLQGTRRRRMFCRLPMLCSVLILLAVYLISPGVWLDGEGNPTTRYYLMMVFIPVIYILSSFVFSLKNALEAKRRQEKHLYLLIGIYPLGVVFFGLLQTFLVQAPLFCCGCTLMMLFFYILNMQTQVSLDPLTRLSNRGQIERYMSQLHAREDQRTYVMMIDVDHFKEINDTYGHREGDRALVMVAEALRQAAENLPEHIFPGRYGGDEFVVFVRTGEGDAYMDQLSLRIRYSLREKQMVSRLPYQLNISIGYELLREGTDTPEACLIRADEKLYKNKRERR